MAKYLSNGTELYVSTDSGATYTNLSCQITGFSGPGATSPEINVTTLCSTAKEFIGGLVDNGSLQITGFFDPAETGVALMKTLADSRDVVDWKIIWNDTANTNWTFDGYVSEFSVSAQADEAMGYSATVRISGAITEV